MRYLILALMISVVVVGCEQKEIVYKSATYASDKPRFRNYSSNEENTEDYFELTPQGDWDMNIMYRDDKNENFIYLLSHPTDGFWKVILKKGDSYKGDYNEGHNFNIVD